MKYSQKGNVKKTLIFLLFCVEKGFFCGKVYGGQTRIGGLIAVFFVFRCNKRGRFRVKGGVTEKKQASAKEENKTERNVSMTRRIIAAVLALGIAGAITAAENDGMPSREGRRAGMNMRGGRGFGRNGRAGGFGGMMARMNPLARFKAEEEIRQKFPKELDEALKQLAEAEKKVAELAKKAKVELPESNDSKLRQIQAKKPAEFAKLVKEEDFRKAFTGLRELAEEAGVEFGGMGPRQRGPRGPEGAPGAENAPRRRGPVDMARLRRMYPEEMKKLDEIRRSDRDAYRKGLMELIKKSKEQKSGNGQNK